MSSEKTQEKTPILYTLYDKQYDFNDLQRSADTGLAEYISGLKRGSKDEVQFRTAYSNIMNGIKDGSITFKNGQFVDTKYGYHNSTDKDKNKDHYGLMANYIFNKMGNAPEYVKPESKVDESKIKWNGSQSVGAALIRELYNSNQENLQDFIDVDKYDEESKTRGISGRTSRLASALGNVRSNFDNLFAGFTDSDKTNAVAYIDDAIKSLNDGSIDAGDYLALSRAASGLSYRNMFTGGSGYNPETPEQPSQDPNAGRKAFVKWVSEKYPQFSGTLRNPRSLTVDKTYGPHTLNQLKASIDNLSTDNLYRIIRSALSDPNYVFNNEQVVRDTFKDVDYEFANPFGVQQVLESLDRRGLLQPFGEDNLNLRYIPNTDNSARQTAWVWDTLNKSISEMSYHDIPYWREKIKQEYLQSGGTGEDPYWASRYFKSGGIIKAQAGTVMDRNKGRGPASAMLERSNNWLAVDNTSANASNVNTWDEYYRMSDILSHIKQSSSPDSKWTPWGSAGYNRGTDGKIITDDSGQTKYGLNASQLAQKLNELESLGSGLSWDKTLNGRGYDAWNRKFDETGFNNYFGGDSSKFDYMGPSTYNRHALLNQMKTEYGKDNPLSIDKGSLYWDGAKWQQSSPDVGDLKLNVEATIPKPDDLKIQELSTEINPVTVEQKEGRNIGQGVLNVLGGLAPELIGAGRLALSLNTNNKVSKTIRPSLKPVLQDTYELYSPITGAFSEMQLRNRQGADVRRMASRPITSDASLAVAAQMDASRQANELQYQGFLADDREIQRTQAEALRRQEDNTARRSQVANANRAAINQTGREIAQLEATRLRSNWQSWDNYLQGVEGRLRYKLREKEAMRNAATREALGAQYQDAITKLDNLYREANPNATSSSMLADANYINAVKDLQRQYQYNSYNLNLGNQEDPYRGYKSRSYEDILGSYKFSAKSGGQLKPSALYLINKVIRNENNT